MSLQPLSGLDALFLHLETPAMPMHIGALQLLELPSGFRGRFDAALRRHIAARLDSAPVLRRRLVPVPLKLADPAWTEAEPDLAEHVRAVRLAGAGAAGAGIDELEAAVAELHAQPLPRDRPLWRMWVFDGLAQGPQGQRRVAIYTQLHHAAVDGQAAVALGRVLLDTQPVPAPARMPRRRQAHAAAPGTARLLGQALTGQASKLAGLLRRLPQAGGTLKDAALRAAARGMADDGDAPSNLTLAPRTPFNASVGPRRRYATLTLPLAELRALAQALDITLNELVLLLCAGALRGLLQRTGALPRQPLVAAVPLSLRAAGDGRADNQASISLVSLGTHLADPRKRLQHVRKASASMKAAMGALREVLPTDYPSLGVPWLLEAAASLYGRARLADRLPQVANLVISNVPGPAQPLYLAGARLLASYPASIVVHGLALNITVQTLEASLDIGIVADADALAAPRELAQDLVAALDELHLLAPGVAVQPVPTLAALARLGLGRLARRGVAQVGSVAEAVASGAQRGVGQAARGLVQAAVRGALAAALEPAAEKPSSKRSPAAGQARGGRGRGRG